MFESKLGAPLSANRFNESEEISLEGFWERLFEGFAQLVHTVGEHSEVSFYVGTMALEESLVNVSELLSHCFPFTFVSKSS